MSVVVVDAPIRARPPIDGDPGSERDALRMAQSCVFCGLLSSGDAESVAREPDTVAFLPLPDSSLTPGADHDGGRIVFEGTPADLVVTIRSTLTGQHLASYVGT